jgi:adenine phosphoribosyltransferase
MPAPLDLKQIIRSIPDFPKPGILFRDITPLIAHPAAFRQTIDTLANHYRGQPIDAIVAAEARGFIFAAPLALALDTAFVPVRKPGKLPYKTHAFKYDLEYGSDALHLHTDALRPGQRVLLVDDLLATGGTIGACVELARMSQAEVVGLAFIIELSFLGGRQKLQPYEVFSLVEYDSES